MGLVANNFSAAICNFGCEKQIARRKTSFISMPSRNYFFSLKITLFRYENY
jgi:hypothetical protein